MRHSNTGDLTDDPKRLIPTRALRTLLGDVSNMTIWRRQMRDELPTPIKINGRNYWRLGEVLAWIEARSEDADGVQQTKAENVAGSDADDAGNA